MNRKSLAYVITTLAIGLFIYCFRPSDIKDDSNPKLDPVMLNLFSVKTEQSWLLRHPDLREEVALTQFVPEQKHALGHYQIDLERGTLALMYPFITPVYGDTAGTMKFVAPFRISNQGSGVFYYLGLFELNFADAKVRQLDQLFLADRIEFQGVDALPQEQNSTLLTVNLLQHDEQQSMSEKPKQSVKLAVVVTDDRLVRLAPDSRQP